MTGQNADEAEKEVKVAIQRVFHWAAYTDKYGGTVQVRMYLFNNLIGSISSNFFSLEVQEGSSLIDPMLLQEET